MLGRIFTAIVLAVLVAPAATAQNLQEGLAAYNRGDYAAALTGLRPLALKRDAKAQYKLAFMYLRGEGVRQDDMKAVAWFRKAAEQGHTEAQYNLAVMYHIGIGVPPDTAEAVKWFRRAAERGHGDARTNLIFMQEKGLRGAAKAPPAPARGGFRVQLGAVRLKAHAAKEARRLNRLHKLVLGSLKVVPVRADLGKRGVVYRLRAGPLDGRASANSLCRILAARKQSCIVVKPR